MSNDELEDLDEFEDYGPSKSQRKRECDALQDLGVALLDLNKSELDQCPISDELRRAIDHLKTIKSRPALKRQRQFIGRLMRSEDGEAIQEFIDRRKQQLDRDAKIFHRYETLRDQLVHEGDSAIPAVLEMHPNLERSRLRQLIRKAQQPPKPGQRNSGARDLFRYLWAQRNSDET